ncbi:MAG TPA: PQQ-dependent sugar dehydrogenase [Candidatus Binatia bacterium]|jgi:glucose/arabinose dehydrogenase
MKARWLLPIFCTFVFSVLAAPSSAQIVNDPSLKVETVVDTGLDNPTTMAFIPGGNDFFILQKDNGKVMLVHNGTAAPVLDLNVDFDEERGLLGIALDPQFDQNGFVYLYYTETSANGDTEDPNSATANVVRKFYWDGSALTAEPGGPILSLPIDVSDAAHHNGGIILFGPDGKLYVIVGDRDRNGQLQNFQNGPPPDGTSVIYRLNPDGSIPTDVPNPFFNPLDPTNNLGKYFAYGVRNSFGMAFDPVTHKLWDTENGETTYDEINLVEPGFNSGWQSIMGPDSRNSNNAPQDLFVLSGSHYADPKFSWFDTQGPTAIVFLNSTQLGSQYLNDVFIGDINNGRIYHFVPNQNRDGFVLPGNLSDLVAENDGDTAPLRFASQFNGITDLKVGPDDFLYVVSLGNGAVYRIVPAAPQPPPLTMNTTFLPDAVVGVPYDEALGISGGADPYTISRTAGTLPPGILPSATGLSGTPQAAKKFKFTLQVRDDDGATVSRQFSIQVFKALAISTQSLKDGKMGKNYKATLKATGGKGPYTWALKNGSSLPNPLMLTGGNQITGVPAAPFSGNVTFQVTDGLGITKEKTFSLTIGN